MSSTCAGTRYLTAPARCAADEYEVAEMVRRYSDVDTHLRERHAPVPGYRVRVTTPVVQP